MQLQIWLHSKGIQSTCASGNIILANSEQSGRRNFIALKNTTWFYGPDLQVLKKNMKLPVGSFYFVVPIKCKGQIIEFPFLHISNHMMKSCFDFFLHWKLNKIPFLLLHTHLGNIRGTLTMQYTPILHSPEVYVCWVITKYSGRRVLITCQNTTLFYGLDLQVLKKIMKLPPSWIL